MQQCAKSSSSDGRVHQISRRRRRKEGCRRTWIIGGTTENFAKGGCKFFQVYGHVDLNFLDIFLTPQQQTIKASHVIRPTIDLIA